MKTTKYTRRQVLVSAASGLAASMLVPKFAYAASKSLSDVKASGVLQIGCEATYPPFTFRDAGKIVGYDVDLANLMCASLGVKPEFIDTQWSGVIPALYAGRFDVIMSSMSYRKERLKKVAFSIPYAEASQAMLIRADDASKIISVKDLSGKVHGVKL